MHEGGIGVEALDDGSFQFRRPDGRILHRAPAPPHLPHDPAAAMMDRNRSDGVSTTPWTPTPVWHGQRLDLAFALDVLRR